MTPKLWRRAAAVLAGALLLLLVPLFVPAAEDEKPLGKLPPDLALVPRDTLLFVTVRLGDVAADERAKKLLPLLGEQLKRTESIFGLKLAEIERLTAVVRRMGPFSGAPVFIFRTLKAIDKDAYFKRFTRKTETTLHGKTVVIGSGDEFPPRPVWIADDRTIVHGVDSQESFVGFLGALALGGKTHALADELKVAAGTHTLVVAARPELMARTMDAEMRAMERPRGIPIKDRKMPPRDFRKEGPVIKEKEVPPPPRAVDKDKAASRRSPRPLYVSFKDVPKDAPVGFKEAPPKDGIVVGPVTKETPLKLRTMEEILNDDTRPRYLVFETVVFKPVMVAKRALLTADLGETITAEARADYDNADDAKDGEAVARMGLYLLREMFPVVARSELHLDLKSKPMAGLLKQFKDAVRSVEVKADGKTLTGTAKVKLDLAPLLKAVADEAPARTQTNNLKQIGIAFHNYHAAYNYLPPPAICDGRGKPLLSWRVAILPYIEQDKLYREFKLDEPWDSPHNKKLISKMPKLYHPVVTTGADPTSTATHYQVFTGPNTLFPKPDAKTRITDVFDGLSNTFMVVEAGKAVPWTKPDDIDASGKELPKLGGQFPGFLHVVFGDGAVRRIKRGADERLLRLFIDPKDGTPLDHDKLKP